MAKTTTLKHFVDATLSLRPNGFNSCEYHWHGTIPIGTGITPYVQKAPQTLPCKWDGENLLIGYLLVPGTTVGTAEGNSFVWRHETKLENIDPIWRETRIFFNE